MATRRTPWPLLSTTGRLHQSCAVCRKELSPEANRYCSAHSKALQNVKHAFNAWTSAYGALSVSDFLQRILKLSGTGQKAKDVAQFMLEKPSRWQ